MTNIEISQLSVFRKANSTTDQRSQNQNYQTDRCPNNIASHADFSLSGISLKVGNLKLLQLRNKNRRTQPPFRNRRDPLSPRLHHARSPAARAVAVALWATRRTCVVKV